MVKYNIRQKPCIPAPTVNNFTVGAGINFEDEFKKFSMPCPATTAVL